MEVNNKYGYVLGYKEFDYERLKIYSITRSFYSIIWTLNWYQSHPFYDKYDNHLILKPIWHINDVKSLKEYNKLWEGCPFKDDLSN